MRVKEAACRASSEQPHLKLNGPARLPLHHRSSAPHPAIEGYIVNPKRDEVAGSQLAVERQIEQSQVANAVRNLEPDPNEPDLFSFERRLGSD